MFNRLKSSIKNSESCKSEAACQAACKV
jgi:hypothetical protein